MEAADREFNLDLPDKTHSPQSCTVCVRAKATRTAIHKQADPQYKATRPIQILHADLVGPVTILGLRNKKYRCPTIDGQLYALIITEEYTHTVFVELLRDKSDAANAIITLVKWLQVRTGWIVVRFHTDGGGEFINRQLINFFQQNGTEMTNTTADTPRHNGIAERSNRTLFETARTLLLQASAPPSLWGDALRAAAHLYNVSPHQVTNFKVPFMTLFNYRYNLQKLRVWGCDAHVLVLSNRQSKIEARTWVGAFIGYDKETKAYRVINAETCAITVSMDVRFEEDKFTQIQRLKGKAGRVTDYRCINPFSLDEDEQLDDDQLYDESDGIEVVNAQSSRARDPIDSKENDSSAGFEHSVGPMVDDRTNRVGLEHSVDPMGSDRAKHASKPARDAELEAPEPAVEAEPEDPEPAVAEPESKDSEPANAEPVVEDSEPAYDAEPEFESSEPVDADPESKDSETADTEPEADADKGQASESEAEEEKELETEFEYSAESRRLREQYSAWNERPAPTSTEHTRSGRAIIRSTRSIASDPRNYLPEDMHHALTERTRKRLQQANTLSTAAPSEHASLFIQVDHDHDYIFSAQIPSAEPQHYKDAIKSPEADAWRDAMAEEYKSLEKLKVWSIVDCPERVKPLSGRWVFKNKLGDQNQLVRRKARFVVRGYLQVHGRDYNETHSPVAKMKSIKLILSIAAKQDLELHQLDFDTAFLNAPVEEEIYVEQPEGFHRGGPNKVLKLLKALYGLKQAPRQWNKTIDHFMQKLGYRALRSDPCVYIKLSRTNRLIILSLYVDDTVICFHKDDRQEWLADKLAIAQTYAIKDMGECNWILNMKVTRDRAARTITLSQQAFIERITKQLGPEEAQAEKVPMKHNYQMWRPNEESTALDPKAAELYRSITGALLYAANITRIDIAYAVGQLCRYTAAPCIHHLSAARQVLRYVRSTSQLCLVFGNRAHNATAPIVDVYCDSDWGGDKKDGKSTTGCVIRFNGDVMNWVSKKQSSVAMSSAEAEYMAMAEAVKEALWYRSWISEVLNVYTCPTILCDNAAAITLSDNDTIHERSKHIGLRYHFIRDEKSKKHIHVKWIKSQQQQADILTKALDRTIFERLRDKLLVNP